MSPCLAVMQPRCHAASLSSEATSVSIFCLLPEASRTCRYTTGDSLFTPMDQIRPTLSAAFLCLFFNLPTYLRMYSISVQRAAFSLSLLHSVQFCGCATVPGLGPCGTLRLFQWCAVTNKEPCVHVVVRVCKCSCGVNS